MPKSDFTDSGVGCIHYGQIYTHYGTWATKTISFVAPDTARKLAKVDPGDLIITNTSEDLDDVCKTVAWLGDAQIVTGGHATVLKHEQDPRYLSYYLQTPPFFAQKKKRATGTKVIDVSAKSLAGITIPVPPLEVQREIVRVLDTFTELEAELEARRRQYEHYRDSLLSSPERACIRWVALGDLARINFGARITKAKDAGTLYPVYGGGGESFRTDQYNRQDEWVISRFAMSENCVRRVRGRFWMLDSGFTFDVAADLNKDYLGQVLLNMQPVIFATSTQSAQKNIDIDGFKRLTIPVPPREEQERIVSILDRFDALVNDLSIGLPAELAARRTQYEHYRDRLLTFPQAA